MRRARIQGCLYPLKTYQQIREALTALKWASRNQVASPSLTSLIRYRPEPPSLVEDWQTVVELENSLVGDCEDIANRYAKLLRDKGLDADTWIVAMASYAHIIVRCEGQLLDPCYSAGMSVEPDYAAYVRRWKVKLI